MFIAVDFCHSQPSSEELLLIGMTVHVETNTCLVTMLKASDCKEFIPKWDNYTTLPRLREHCGKTV